MNIIKVAACVVMLGSATSIVVGCRSKQQSSSDSASGAIAPIDTNPAPSNANPAPSTVPPASVTNVDTACCGANTTGGHGACTMSRAAMDSMRKAMHGMTGHDSIYMGQMRSNCQHTGQARQRRGHQSSEKK